MEIRFLQTLLLAAAAAAAAAASCLTHANIAAATTGDLALVCALFSGEAERGPLTAAAGHVSPTREVTCAVQCAHEHCASRLRALSAASAYSRRR